jgi:hypothetical protein
LAPDRQPWLCRAQEMQGGLPECHQRLSSLRNLRDLMCCHLALCRWPMPVSARWGTACKTAAQHQSSLWALIPLHVWWHAKRGGNSAAGAESWGVMFCAGLSQCEGVCRNTSSDFLHCGFCNNRCRAGAACVGGQCRCQAGGSQFCGAGLNVCAQRPTCAPPQNTT